MEEQIIDVNEVERMDESDSDEAGDMGSDASSVMQFPPVDVKIVVSVHGRRDMIKASHQSV